MNLRAGWTPSSAKDEEDEGAASMLCFSFNVRKQMRATVESSQSHRKLAFKKTKSGTETRKGKNEWK